MHQYTILVAPADTKLKEVLLGAMAKRANYQGDAGMDLANLREDFRVPAGTAGTKIPLGYKICVRREINGVWHAWPWAIVVRSSTARTPLRLSNAVGIIDAGYRDEIMAIVDNGSSEDFVLKHGEARFQLVLGDMTPLDPQFCNIVVVNTLPS